jgi:hypothetical protein
LPRFAYSTCNPYVVGDLSKKEAEEYFEKYVLPRYGMALLNPSIYMYSGLT